MKQGIRRSLGVLLVLSAMACATSAQKTTYDVLGVAVVAVDTGMKVYADAVVAGKVSQDMQAKVRKDFAAYQQAMTLARGAVDAWYSVGATPATFPAAQVGAALAAAGTVQAEVK